MSGMCALQGGGVKPIKMGVGGRHLGFDTQILAGVDAGVVVNSRRAGHTHA